jgi:hypothetical protein
MKAISANGLCFQLNAISQAGKWAFQAAKRDEKRRVFFDPGRWGSNPVSRSIFNNIGYLHICDQTFYSDITAVKAPQNRIINIRKRSRMPAATTLAFTGHAQTV